MAEKNPPLIGVAPLVDEGRDSYWMLPGYFEGVLEAGGVPVMLPLTDDPEVLAELVSLAARYGRTCPSRDPPRSSTMAFLRTRNPCMRWTLFRQLRLPR